MSDHSHDSPYRSHKPKPSPSHRGTGKGRARGGAKRGGGKAHAKAHAKGHAHHGHQLVSHPTTRGAYVDTRAWLLKTYGPICAYCGQKFNARTMTLDHVAPRRGQSAYDRRDNLVLACTACNAAKRDQAPLAFLLGLRSRAVNLAKYGAHLSHGLLEMAKSLIPGHMQQTSGRANIDYSRWGPPVASDEDDDSPYKR